MQKDMFLIEKMFFYNFYEVIIYRYIVKSKLFMNEKFNYFFKYIGAMSESLRNPDSCINEVYNLAF